MYKIETWICTTLFAVGIIFGMTYLNLSGYTLTGKSVAARSDYPSGPDDRQTAEPGQSRLSSIEEAYQRRTTDPELEQQNEGMHNDVLVLADRYLISGNYALALENYYDFEKSVADAGSAVILRQAFCSEMQKRFKVAEEKYYRALTEAASESHRLMGFAGLARCLSKEGKQSEALDMLAEQNLKLDQYVGIPDEIRAQIVYQFAKQLEFNAIGGEMDLTQPRTAAFEHTQPKPEIYLNSIDQRQSITQLPTSTQLRFDVLQRPSNSLSVISASISAKLEPVGILIGQIAANAELQLEISQRALVAVENRARTIELQSTPLSTVLDQLLVPFDLVWYQLDSELHIVAEDEVDPNIARRQFWFDSAQRAFRRFELTFDDGIRRQSSLLSRANLSFMQNNFDVAANQYQELTQTQPTEEVLAKLFFNQAKLSMALDRIDDANRLLFLSVDQTMNPDIQSSAYCLLGGNFLAQGELPGSIKVSRRGLAMAVNDKQKRLASLNLARAYLLSNEPFMANKQLFDNKDYYEDSAAERVASILGAYARFIGVRDETGIRIAQNRLLTAITMVPEENYQSFADAYFVGLAYERLGFREKAVEKLLLALAQTDVGQWRRQIMFEMAILQKRLKRFDESSAVLEALLQPTDDQWNRFALEQLAQIYIETDAPEKCIEICKRLWELPLAEPQKKQVLQLLGDAYQMKGEHYTAALFFAGVVPDRF